MKKKVPEVDFGTHSVYNCLPNILYPQNLDSASYKSEQGSKDVNEDDHRTYEDKLSDIVDKIEQ